MGFQLLTLNGQKVGELTETTFRLCGSVGDDVGQNCTELFFCFLVTGNFVALLNFGT